MKLNGFQSKNVEEEKIIPRLTAAKPNFVINIAPDTPLKIFLWFFQNSIQCFT